MAVTELASAAEIEQFYKSALVSWSELYIGNPETLTNNKALLNGTILYNLWNTIDSDSEVINPPEQVEEVEFTAARIKNFHNIVLRVQEFYQSQLQQILLRIPDCFVLAVQPESKAGLENLKLLLVLILGAAVQCPRKEIFVERIKELDVSMQFEVVQIIKEVTESCNIVIIKDIFGDLPSGAIYDCIKLIDSERRTYYTKWISAVSADSPEVYSNAVYAEMPQKANGNDEIQDLKSTIRKLRQELDEKSDLHADLKSKVDYQAQKLTKLQSENQELLALSKQAQAYQDELDDLREKAIEADHMKLEIQKLREKLNNTGFYKAKMDELQANNQILHETKLSLEEQLKRSRMRCQQQTAAKLEADALKQKLDEYILEQRLHQEKIRELMIENNRLRSTNHQEPIVCDTERVPEYVNTSISEQINDSMQTKLLTLELENSRLQAQVDQIKLTPSSNEGNIAEVASLASRSNNLQEMERRISSLACQQMANETLISNLRKSMNQKILLLNNIRSNLTQLGFVNGVFESTNDGLITSIGKLFTNTESFHRFIKLVSAAYNSSGSELAQPENVETVTFLAKIASLESKVNSIQKQNFQLTLNKEKLMEQVEAFKQNHRIMSRDQNRLTRQYERLLSDYESVVKDRDLLKQLLNHVKEENVELKGRSVRQEKSNAEEVAVLKAEHSKLTEDFCGLYATCDQYRLSYDSLKSEYSILQGENDRLKGQINELSLKIDTIMAAENDYTSLADRCEMLMNMNTDLTRERRVLMDNVSQLLGQYHELLSHSIEDKQHYHESCQNYLDKVSLLSNQKERLEMKIMDQYKTSESATKKKENSLIKRMKKASSDFINKVPSRSRKSWAEDTGSTPSKPEQNDSESISPESEQTSDSRQHSPTELSFPDKMKDRFEEMSRSRRSSFFGISLESSDEPINLNFLEAGNRKPIYANEEK